MIKLLLIIGLIPYSLAFVMYMPHFIKEFSYVKGQLFWFSLASTCLFIGQGQMFSHETYMSNTSVYDVGMIYQISWMVSGGIILTVLLARNGYSQNAERLPIIMLAIYGILGVITSVYSPAPLYSTYKSMQVLLDFMLVATAVNLLVKHKRPDLLLNLTIFLLSFVIMSAAAGGIFLPELAYHELYGGGAFGHTLNSVFPEVHSNELGLLSSCLVVVSLRRMAEDVQTKLCRYYWMSLGVLSLMVLIGAQARTSIAALTISIVVMAYFIPKLRWLSYCIAILAIVLVVYYQISGTELGIMDSITNYLRRGATDQQLSSLSGRTELWQAGFRMFKDSPFIGYGFQAGARMAGAAYGVPNGTNMHSGHMQVLIDSGLVGYILWLMFVVSMLFLPISVLKKKVLSMKTEIGRFHLEVTLIMFVIFFRSFLGEVLVTHEISTMLFLGGYIYVLTNQILRRGGTGRVAEQELSGKPAQKLNYIPRRRQ